MAEPPALPLLPAAPAPYALPSPSLSARGQPTEDALSTLRGTQSEQVKNCHNSYLGVRIVATDKKLSYESQKAVIIEQAEEKKKISGSKALAALTKLCYFRPDPLLVEPLAQVLERYMSEREPDRRLVRLLHMHVALAAAPVRVAGPAAAVSACSKEAARTQAAWRRVPALRSLAALAGAEQPAALSELLTDTLRRLDMPLGEAGDRKTTRAQTPQSLRLEKEELQRACFCALRWRTPRPVSLLMPLLEGARTDDPVVARHAMALLLNLLADDKSANMLVPSLRRLLPHVAERDALLLPDAAARTLLARIAAHVACPQPPPDKSKAKAEVRFGADAGDFYQALCQGLIDISERVFMQSVLGLAAGSWSRLADAHVLLPGPPLDASGNAYQAAPERTPVLPQLLQRFADLLEHATGLLTRDPAAASDAAMAAALEAAATRVNPFVHAACRTIAALARSYACSSEVPSLVSAPDVQSAHLMYSLVQPVTRVLQHFKRHTRLQAMRALLWLALPADPAELLGVLVEEMRRDSLPADLWTLFARELHVRVTVTPAAHTVVLPLVEAMLALRPDVSPLPVLADCWRDVLGLVQPLGRQLVLRSLLAILDCPPLPEHQQAAQRVVAHVFEFVGEHAVLLTVNQPQRYAVSSFQQKPPGAAVSDFHSGSLKALLLRLEAALTFGSLGQRRSALEAMARVAFASDFPVKLHVYEFLRASLPHDSSLAVHATAVVRQLDRQFELLEKLERGGAPATLTAADLAPFQQFFLFPDISAERLVRSP